MNYHHFLNRYRTLTQLTSVEDILDLLTTNRIKGTRSSIVHCPIARYLSGEGSDSDSDSESGFESGFEVMVDPATIGVYTQGIDNALRDKYINSVPGAYTSIDWTVFPSTPAIQDFLLRFDKGEFPHISSTR